MKGHYLRKPRSEETKLKISLAMRGRTLTEAHRANIGASMEGKEGMVGSKNPNWKGGATERHKKIRNSLKYKVFKEKVMYRDNWTCVLCGENGTCVDHIKSFAHFPKLRFTLSNARTLCQECHEKTDTYGYKGKRKPDGI